MPSIVFVLPDRSERTVTVDAGTSVMLAAVGQDLPGVVGECVCHGKTPGCQERVLAATCPRASKPGPRAGIST